MPDRAAGPDLIDLGELGPDAAAGPGPARPEQWTRGRLLAVVVLACLLLLARATPAAPDPNSPLWTMQRPPGTSVLPGGRAVFLVEPMAGLDLQTASVVSALDAATGRTLWRLPVAGGAPQRVLDAGGGVDAIVIGRPVEDGPDDTPATDRTIFLSRATGAVLALYAGDPVRVTAGVAIVEQRGSACPDGPSECDDVTGLNLATGAVDWRLTLLAGGRVLAGGVAGPDTFTTADGNGSLTLRAVRTAAAGMTVAGHISGGGGVRLSTVADGVLVVGYPRLEATELSGYRADTLAPLWTINLPRDAGDRQPQTGLVGLRACGDRVCVRDGGGTAVLDAGRGTLLFRTPLSILTEVGTGVFLGVPYLGRLDSFGRFVTDVPAIDPRTGARVSVVEDATPVDGGPDPRVTAGLVRQVAERRTTFAAVAADGVATRLVTVYGTDLGCVAGPTGLVCVTDAGVLRGWLPGP